VRVRGEAKSHYDADFYAWTQQQAKALAAKDWAALALDHLVEEIESLGIADEHAITRHLQRLLLHLLKWRYQPTHRTPSWRRSIRQARDRIPDRIKRSPTCATIRSSACPWALAQVLDEDWWPERQP
jgi:hypothetical protein